ncbi:MAG TPA: twin-arginine translocase subunit TatC [Polyangia bacterium]|jgi:sec-independent protein translocase protein TatC|nr:twin-arginine translocase subunit TatC [Polyangia bacterium]
MTMPAARPEETVEDERRMPFTEHLSELRLRLRNSVLGLLVATMVSYMFRGPLFALIARPLIQAWSEASRQGALPPPEMVFTSPVEAFMVLFKLALLAGVFLASPIIFHQLWQFVSPGLYDREKRLALPLVIVSVLLFVGGGLFAYIFVLPKAYEYFLGYSDPSMGIIRDVLGRQELWGHKVDIRITESFAIKPMITMDEYFGLTSTLLLLFGAVFELPMLLGMLAMLGIVSPGGLWRFNRYFILIAFVAGAVLTPGDLVVGQLAMGGALTVLYNLSIGVAVIMGWRKRRAAAAAAAVGEEAAR